MIVPETVYRFVYPRDFSGTSLDLVTRRADQTAVAASQELAGIRIPADKVFVMSAFNARADPGSESVNNMRVREGIIASTTARPVLAEIAPLATGVRTIDRQGEWWIPGGHEVTIFVTFSAAVVAKTIEINVFGVLIPRGSVTLF